MRLFFPGALLVVLLLDAASLAAQTQQAGPQADGSFTQAVARADRAALGGLLDADFTWTDANGKTWTRAEILRELPKPAAPANGSQAFRHRYGQVEMIQEHSGRDHVLRIWAQRPAGWKLLIYQEVRLLDSQPVATPGTGAACDNPCKTVPYEPKDENERQAVAAYMGLQTATVARDSAAWGTFVADEFAAANSNSNQVLDKRGRMEDLERNKMAGYSPMPVVKMNVLNFGDAMVLVTEHQPEHGKPVHITRMWIKRDGHWMEAASYQTRIQSAPAQP
jgi:Domain of unknown function (DUF4440)